MDQLEKFNSCFNDKFGEFLSDVIRVIPNDKDIKMFKTSFQMLKVASEHSPRQMFHKFVSPYYDQITSRDVNFFKENKSIYKVNTGIPSTSVTDELVDKLSHYWDELTEEDHTVIWDYMNLLVKLCKKCETLK